MSKYTEGEKRFNYPDDLFDNLIWLHEHRLIRFDMPDGHLVNTLVLNKVEKQQYVFHFSNGYGASVIKGPGSYGYDDGLWELGVLSEMGGEWHLNYSTEITDDVVGYLSVEEVKSLLERIKQL